MDRDEYKKYFAIFELPQDASFADVNDAYSKVKQTYAAEIATTPNFEEDNRKIIEQIDEAYQRLAGLFAEDGQASILEDLNKTEGETNLGKEIGIDEKDSPDYENKSIDIDKDKLLDQNGNKPYSGDVLRRIRKRKGISLKEIAYASKIQARTLECMENEDYEPLPPRVYIKGFIVTYAKYLELDHHKVSEDYMERYNIWSEEKLPPRSHFRRSKNR